MKKPPWLRDFGWLPRKRGTDSDFSTAFVLIVLLGILLFMIRYGVAVLLDRLK